MWSFVTWFFDWLGLTLESDCLPGDTVILDQSNFGGNVIHGLVDLGMGKRMGDCTRVTDSKLNLG
jgi:hypothetical protein